MKTIFLLKSWVRIPFCPMKFFLYFKINIISDNSLLDTFFNFSNNCINTYFSNFYLEILLIAYIIYNVIFYKENKNNYKLFYFQFIFFLTFLCLICSFNFIFYNVNYLKQDILINNNFVLISKCFVLFITLMIFLICKNKFMVKPKYMSVNEIPIIFCFLLLFISLLLSAYDFFIIYLTIEGISLIIYTLGSVMNESLINLESIMKYFLINNMASSLLLWSISYLYIITGSTDCFELQYFFSSHLELIKIQYLYNICFLLLISILIKLAIFPFQWWIADVFEGLWTPITLTYAVLIKFTFFIFFFKLILNVFNNIIFLFQTFLFIAALGSVIIGSIGALIQIKLKRFLAYTSIAQSGYIIMGLACNSINGFLSSLLYLYLYCIITLAFFCILLNIEHISKGHNITYFNQVYSILTYNKEITFHLVILLLIMAAIPPFTSFFAKFFIFIVTIEAKLELITCIILGMTLISTFYYLNFIQQLTFFKFDESKIFYYKNNIIIDMFLRVNTLFFTIGIFFIIVIYDFSFNLVLNCMYPLCV